MSSRLTTLFTKDNRQYFSQEVILDDGINIMKIIRRDKLWTHLAKNLTVDYILLFILMHSRRIPFNNSTEIEMLQLVVEKVVEVCTDRYFCKSIRISKEFPALSLRKRLSPERNVYSYDFKEFFARLDISLPKIVISLLLFLNHDLDRKLIILEGDVGRKLLDTIRIQKKILQNLENFITAFEITI